MGPYHALMVHVPVSFWTAAALILIVFGLSERPIARAFDRVLVLFLILGTITGIIAYMLGLLVWPPDTLQTTPLGRNHMMAATWSLFYWTAVLVLRWWAGERI